MKNLFQKTLQKSQACSLSLVFWCFHVFLRAHCSKNSFRWQSPNFIILSIFLWDLIFACVVPNYFIAHQLNARSYFTIKEGGGGGQIFKSSFQSFILSKILTAYASNRFRISHRRCSIKIHKKTLESLF